ncbi:MAG: PTS fructose-like transporter subunit IIB [Candidatus Accumulibacter phosphatis]|jgi:PTS system fructose-specific IIC component|uniref:protein-N(pi)-phosphohistidine--D-fructose phosphotransferase n=1 Tax=Candidatus Accumulibacter contiguus TaxID=2954381 RepID=A0ABX1TI33_9PROT|nr:PTS fructose-like transporter subunit IIB [Candidatus Accumulibacter contiguus]NMQ07887.1 PTS fructose-like transporter subunit IIB [Candidatus Accumulibacter contiguus]
MAKIIAVTACPTGIAHTYMAAEALKKTAALLGHSIRVETQGAAGARDILDDADLAAAELVILAADTHVEMTRFAGKAVHETTTSVAIRDPRGVIETALASIGISAERQPRPETAAAAPKRIVAITACPTGIAHTFMAAEALKKAAAQHGYEIKVETQGSVGAKNTLTAEEIAAADVVIIGADTHVDTSRFAGKAVYETSVGRALKETQKVLQEAFALPPPSGAAPVRAAAQAEARPAEKPAGAYKHLLTGVSYMLPIVVAGGLAIALSFIFGIEAFKEKGTLAASLMEIGGGAAFALMIPVLAGFIAFSIADRPGLAPGLVGGMLASQLQAGFLGGIVAGFLAGYVARYLRDHIKLPVHFEGLKPVLLIPLLATLVVGLLMIYVVGSPARAIMEGLTQFLQSLSGTNAVLLGLLLGGMMAVDMGGPINKAAYTFGVGLLASNTFMPMAAVMAAGMVPPLGIALATFVAKNRFSVDEQIAGKAAAVLGISFITEGAIPFAAKDPLRVIPACVAGAATTGALSMFFGCTLHAPHGGIFVLAIPNAVGQLLPYIGAIAVGTLVTTLALIVLKKPLAEDTALTA